MTQHPHPGIASNPHRLPFQLSVTCSMGRVDAWFETNAGMSTIIIYKYLSNIVSVEIATQTPDSRTIMGLSYTVIDTHVASVLTISHRMQYSMYIFVTKQELFAGPNGHPCLSFCSLANGNVNKAGIYITCLKGKPAVVCSWHRYCNFLQECKQTETICGLYACLCICIYTHVNTIHCMGINDMQP